MKNNLNNKKYTFSIMNKLYMFIAMLFILTSSAFAVNQNVLIEWQMEDGTGSLVTDLAPPIITNGFLSNGANFENADVKFGNFDVDFDGGNDVIQASVTNPVFGISPNNMFTSTISLWFKPDNNDEDTLFKIYGFEETSSFELRMDANTQNGRNFKYLDSGLVEQEVILTGISDYNNGEYHHIVFALNPFSNEVTFYFNNLDVGTYALPNIATFEEFYILRLGADENLNNDYNGDIDSFFVTDFIANSSQVNELFTINSITLLNNETNTNQTPEEEQNPVINGLQEYDLINSINYEQNSNSILESQSFIINTNQVSTCDLYINGALYDSSNDLLSHTINNKLESGTYEAFTYCYFVSNGVNYYEISNTTLFNIDKNPPGILNFNINAVDFNQEELALYLVTPCLEKGIVIPGVTKPYNANANKNGAYIQRIVNGQASFTLDEEKHEFCLINGQITYDKNDFTTNYNPNNVFNQIDLGEFDLPSNITTTYSLSVEEFDIYEKTNPKAWGTSWIAIISSLLAIGLGVILVLVGVSMKMPQAIVFGSIMVLFALGFQVSNLLLLVGA